MGTDRLLWASASSGLEAEPPSPGCAFTMRPDWQRSPIPARLAVIPPVYDGSPGDLFLTQAARPFLVRRSCDRAQKRYPRVSSPSRSDRGLPSSVSVACGVSVARNASRSPSLMAATSLGTTGLEGFWGV